VRAFGSVGGTPIFFKSAQGPYLTTVDGEQLIDFCMGFGPHLLGHRDPEVSQVVHEAVDMAWTFGACEPYSLELAEWVTERLPFVEKLRFVNSGTEAVMSALRVARGVTGRSLVVKFEGCYHGHVDSLLVKAGSGLAGKTASDSLGIPEQFIQTTAVLPLDDDNCLQEFFNLHGATVAAVILEPLPANYGLLIQRDEFIKKVVEVARHHGALVIFDEVISGFRVALGGMAERLGLSPDLVTFGKVLGGGLAVGAYGGKTEWMSQVAPEGRVYQAGTLSANPIGMRAGLATLQKAERLHIYEILEQRGRRFTEGLSSWLKAKGYPMEISRVGSIFWFHQQSAGPIRRLQQISPGHSEIFKRLFHQAVKNGVYLAPSGYEVGFLSLAHDDQVLAQASEAIKKALVATYEKI
jgi:glutamate-1-semialdehyde 2,1-aminomutase